VVRQLAQEVPQEAMVEVILLVAYQRQRKARERSWPPRSARPVTEMQRSQRQWQQQQRPQREVVEQVL
jgi:hypothetical protein